VLLSKLATAGAAAGRPLAPLSFHVDYWDDLGWPDPYARRAWTERQREYARALGDDRVYTPELVVAGGAGVVGSHALDVSRAIAAAPHQLAIDAKAKWSETRVEVTASAPTGADVWVALWEDDTHTRVTAGENSGETLGSDRVVRRLERVARAGHTGVVAIPLDRAWRATGAVAFAQRDDRRIVGATILSR
jgi:hypothetical protein